MRKLTEPQAHAGRAAVIDGRYPDGMQARCAWCRRVSSVREGKLMDVRPSGDGPTRAFKCHRCLGRKQSAA